DTPGTTRGTSRRRCAQAGRRSRRPARRPATVGSWARSCSCILQQQLSPMRVQGRSEETASDELCIPDQVVPSGVVATCDVGAADDEGTNDHLPPGFAQKMPVRSAHLEIRLISRKSKVGPADQDGGRANATILRSAPAATART